MYIDVQSVQGLFNSPIPHWVPHHPSSKGRIGKIVLEALDSESSEPLEAEPRSASSMAFAARPRQRFDAAEKLGNSESPMEKWWKNEGFDGQIIGKYRRIVRKSMKIHYTWRSCSWQNPRFYGWGNGNVDPEFINVWIYGKICRKKLVVPIDFPFLFQLKMSRRSECPTCQNKVV